MSSTLSNQSVVHDRTDYEEVYPIGHKDQESPSKERSPSASSPSSTNEDMEIADPKKGTDESEEQPIKSVVMLMDLGSSSCY